jgi:hypothetical protein
MGLTSLIFIIMIFLWCMKIGAGMSVGPTLLPLFEQLGIYEEFLSIGKYLTHTPNFKESLEPYPPIDHSPVEEL